MVPTNLCENESLKAACKIEKQYMFDNTSWNTVCGFLRYVPWWDFRIIEDYWNLPELWPLEEDINGDGLMIGPD